MFAHRQLHLNLATGEVLKWIIILTLASILAALAARLAAGSEPTTSADRPALLPTAIDDWARPMGSDALSRPTAEVPADAAQRVWVILAAQKQSNFEQALAEWPLAPITCDAEAWRHIGLAQAALGLRDLNGASKSLEMALTLEPENAVAHYFRGILLLEQAAAAGEWYDALEPPTNARLISWTGTAQPTLTKSMYQLAARMEFEQALEMAGGVPYDLPLVMAGAPSASAVEPTVRDLLIAVGAENFEGKAHNLLGYLLIERGEGQAAEQHLDSAAALGQPMLYGYDDLGALYQRQHDHLAAVRAYLKTMAHGGGVVRPSNRILDNLREAVIDTPWVY